MATNRSDWLPDVKSRMCEHHFSIDDYVNGDKKNKLRSNACPMFNNTNNVGTFNQHTKYILMNLLLFCTCVYCCIG